MLTALVCAAAAIIAVIAVRIFFWNSSAPALIVRVDKRSPFTLESMTDEAAVFSCRVDFENPGGQYATIMDCMARPQLPFEQYDGIDARAKAEVEGRPREDDYFEAVLVGRSSSLGVLIKVRLAARKGMRIKEALSRMVDLPIDIIYTELGRRPWRMGKARITLTAEEIAQLSGVTLAGD